MASHNARMKQTVEKERSPPESDRMSLAPSPSVVVGCTYKGRDTKCTSVDSNHTNIVPMLSLLLQTET